MWPGVCVWRIKLKPWAVCHDSDVFLFLNIEERMYIGGFLVLKYLFSQASAETFLIRTCCSAVEVVTNSFQISLWQLHDVWRFIKTLLLGQAKGWVWSFQNPGGINTFKSEFVYSNKYINSDLLDFKAVFLYFQPRESGCNFKQCLKGPKWKHRSNFALLIQWLERLFEGRQSTTNTGTSWRPDTVSLFEYHLLTCRNPN